MDNAASFEALAPLLAQGGKRCIYCLDSPGCGLSSRLDTYNIWDELPLMMAFVEQVVKKERFSLIGHSRGGYVATLFAAVCGSRVDRLVLLDGWAWPDSKPVDVVEQLRDFTLKYSRPSPVQRIPRVEDAINVRKELTEQPDEVVRPLMKRACQQDGSDFLLMTDDRLKWPSAVKFTRDQVLQFARSVTAQVLLVAASEGYLADVETKSAEALKAYRSIKVVVVEGHHHLHMNAKCAALLADKHLNAFLPTK